MRARLEQERASVLTELTRSPEMICLALKMVREPKPFVLLAIFVYQLEQCRRGRERAGIYHWGPYNDLVERLLDILTHYRAMLAGELAAAGKSPDRPPYNVMLEQLRDRARRVET